MYKMKLLKGKLFAISLIVALVVAAIPLGAASAAAPAEDAAEAQASQTIHVVQPGETLFKISVRYGVPMADIITVNGIVNPERIYAGQHLIIPTPGSTPAAAQPAVRHVVQRGEYLSQIAVKYGVPMSSILQANRIANPSLLYVGQTLVIPGASSSQQPVSQPAAQPASQPATSSTYVIQPGDTLYKIAVRHGTSVAALMQANGIADMNRIYWGRRWSSPAARVRARPLHRRVRRPRRPQRGSSSLSTSLSSAPTPMRTACSCESLSSRPGCPPTRRSPAPSRSM